MSDVRPVRLQLSRKRGFNLQAHSIATNGLPAVNCARPGHYGNGWAVGVDGSAEECVAKFRDYVVRTGMRYPELRNKNLACWCKIGHPCHADTLLEFAANAPVCEDA